MRPCLSAIGATGVELVAELRNTAKPFVSYGLDRLDPQKDIGLTLIERSMKSRPRFLDF